jgi:DNA-binding CsgD family transcriptional regulator
VTVATERERGRCRERLERLSESGLDCDSLRYEAVALLKSVIGFDRWCWPLADPDTLIPLSGLAEHDYGPAVPRVLELEYSGEDFAAMDVLARRASAVGSLSGEMGGDLARSPRWDEVLRPLGIGDEAAIACRDAFGCWGWIKAYRESAEQPFAHQDLDLLARVGPGLGAALRRSLARDSRSSCAAPSSPGVILLDRRLRPLSWTAGARAWIEALPAARIYAALGMLPAMVYPVATLARSEHGANGSRQGANGSRVLERAVDGRWVMIEAATLEGRGDGAIAVTLRDATAGEAFDRLCRIYALTQRERQVIAAVITGLDTRSITERLFISRHTVQDHLKSVFAKVGVHSRREPVVRFGTSGAESPGSLMLQ